MTSVMHDKIPQVARELGLRPYNGPRTGCGLLLGISGRCSRLRHKHDHTWNGEKLTPWDVQDRVWGRNNLV